MSKITRHVRAIALLLAALNATSNDLPQAHADEDLASGFAQPPQSSKPDVYWHWMNGNISKVGLRLDLE